MLLRNLGGGKFVENSHIAGSGLLVKGSSRGAAFDDLDNDGDLDAVIVNIRGRPTVLRNEIQRKNNWLQIELQGTRSNRDSIGARVEVTDSGHTWIDEVHSGRGYQGHYGTRLHFGLAKSKVVDVTVKWLGGGTYRRQSVKANQRIRLAEPPPGSAK